MAGKKYGNTNFNYFPRVFVKLAFKAKDCLSYTLKVSIFHLKL